MHTFYLQLIFLPFIGFFMGILSMLYGIGGGVIVIPAVYLFLRNLGFDPSISMQISVGTSMLNVLFSTASASYRHYKEGNILWSAVKRMLLFIIIGSLIGVVLVHILPGKMLKNIFIVFLIGIMLHSLFNHNFKRPWKLSDYKDPSWTSAGIMGLLVGALSVLVGIGGGTIILPYFRHYKMPMLHATAVSTTIAPILALIGSVGFFTMHLTQTPPLTFGAINLPIFLCVFIGAWLGVQFGTLISPHFSELWRARSFPALIALIIILMLV